MILVGRDSNIVHLPSFARSGAGHHSCIQLLYANDSPPLRTEADAKARGCGCVGVDCSSRHPGRAGRYWTKGF